MAAPDEGPTRLAAIMFTDIAGYSQKMERDEERTIRLLRRHNEIVLPMIDAAGGEVIDAIGDGLFVLFRSVRDALTCASSIQDAVAMANRTAEPGEQFLLRIGVHLGEVWRDGERVFGNGVNVAARVQPFALPGGICVTEDVHRQLAGRPGHTMVSIGTRELKNISRRFELFRVVTGNESEADDGDGSAASAAGTGSAAEKPGTERTAGAAEFDRIKERLLAERERIASRYTEGQVPDTAEQRIESKVFSLVEHIMDRAMEKWESMPQEKKERIIGKIEEKIEEGLENTDGDVDIVVGGRHFHARGRGSAGRVVTAVHDKPRHKRERDDEDGPRAVVSRLATGTVFGTGFGLGYFLFGVGWMIWPFVLLGAIPFASGTVKAIKLIAARRSERASRPRLVEQRILRTADELGGTVSVVQLARRADLPLDEVQTLLDRMTARGYVTQHVRDSGLIEYEFPRLTGEP